MRVKLTKIDYSIRKLPVQQYYDRMDALHPHGRIEIKAYQDKALAYVWGYQDRAGECETDASIAFADAYGYRALIFREGHVSFMPNLRDAFANWQATGRISGS